MLKFWGRITSINVRKVVLAAQWLEIPFERVDAGLHFGIVKTPEYLSRNPNALVPLMEDEGFVLWESNVIVRYLCAKHSFGNLYPEGLRERFDAERWMDWQQTTPNPAGRNAFWQLLRTSPEKRDAQVIAQSITATEPTMATLDAHLSHHRFVAGDTFTMADIPLACEVHRWRALPIEQQHRPHIDRWYQAIATQPAARGVLDIVLS